MDDLRAEAGETGLDGLKVVEEHLHAVEEGHLRLTGADKEARLEQQGVQRHRFHRHALAAHVGARNDRCAAIKGDGHGDEGSPLLSEKIHDLGVHHIHQFQCPIGDLRADAAVADGEECLLDHKVEATHVFCIGEDVLHHGGESGAHHGTHLRLLAVLLGADTGALNAQLVLLGIGGGVEQLFLHLLLGGADLTQLRRSAVGDIEAARARTIGVEDSQRLLGSVKREAAESHLLVHLLEQGQDALQAAQKALHLEKLHMVGDLTCRAALERVADILHLTQEDHRLIHGGFQLLSVADKAFYVVEFLLQRCTLLGSVELQAANPLDAEGRTAVEGLQNIL